MFAVSVSLSQKNNTPEPRLHWSLAGALPGGINGAQSGLAGAFVGVSEDILWLAGGSNFSNGLPWNGGTKLFHDTVFYFQKNRQGQTFQLLPLRSRLPRAIAYGASIPVRNAVVCAGGQDGSGFSRNVCLVAYSKAKKNIELTELAPLPAGVANAAGVYYDNKIYLAGGETENGTANQLWVLDVSDTNAKWQPLHSLPEAVSHAVLIAMPDTKTGSLYLAGGRRKNPSGISWFYENVYRYDIGTDQWISCQSMPYALSAHTALAVDAETLLVFGGDKGTVFNQVERDLAAISKETDPDQKAKLLAHKNNLQNTHPGFSREILAYHIKTGKWSIIGKLPFPTPVTTTAVFWKGNIILASGETRAGIRTPEIWMGKWEINQ